MNERERKILGIDWGEKKVGLALAAAEAPIAFAVGVLPRKGILSKLTDLIERENVSTVVVGTPRSVLYGNSAREVEKLARALAEAKPEIRVVLRDEFFSTALAERNLREAGRRGPDDAESARVILQDWLDENSS